MRKKKYIGTILSTKLIQSDKLKFNSTTTKTNRKMIYSLFCFHKRINLKRKKKRKNNKNNKKRKQCNR